MEGATSVSVAVSGGNNDHVNSTWVVNGTKVRLSRSCCCLFMNFPEIQVQFFSLSLNIILVPPLQLLLLFVLYFASIPALSPTVGVWYSDLRSDNRAVSKSFVAPRRATKASKFEL